jgi:hypothetical protein
MGANDSIPTVGCGCGGTASIEPRCGGTLPDSPDCANNYHFGMLLGVDDFRADQGFHLGHHRRHQRALHGYGVVYGYGVSFDAKGGQLRVEPGFALDAQGRDLFLGAAQCLSLAAWWDKHHGDDFFAGGNPDDATFDADVLLCYRTCLSRPVPAIADPCAGTSADIAYSRICESVQLTLAPRTAGDTDPDAAAATPPYHALRVLLGMADATDDDKWIAQRQADIAALPADQRASATASLWRSVVARAAAATADPLEPPPWLPPMQAPDDSGADTSGCLVIARLTGVHVYQEVDTWMSAVASIDIDGRMTLVPTQLLQDVLLRPPSA